MRRKQNIKLSIIVPVFNAEQYIQQCLESVFKQGLDDSEFEVILIDDGTEDNSFGVISYIVEKHDNIIVLKQDNNGPSVARNNGILHASGEYILFVDSDDLLIDNSIKELIDLCIEKSVDLLVPNFVIMSDEKKINELFNVSEEVSVVEKKGYELYLEDFDPYHSYVWRILYRRSFLIDSNLSFIPGICFEDLPFIQESYIKAKKCLRVYKSTYIYRVGHCSMTSSLNVKKAMDLNIALAKLWDLRNDSLLPDFLLCKLNDNIFATFSFEMWCISHNRKLLDNRQKIVSDLKKRVPKLWFNNGWKQVLNSLMFRTIPGFYLKARSIIN